MGAARNMGVEEEFLLIDADTYEPAPRVLQVLDDAKELTGAAVEPELHSAQIETATPPCGSVSELRRHLTGLRKGTAEAAGRHGARVAASATFPGRMGESGRLITPKPRYRQMPELSGTLAREHLISGCHVHVSVEDPGAAIRVINRARRWTACLVALSVNSPYWEGQDTGFHSFRTEVWARWPMAGPTGEFSGMEDYEQLLERLISSGVILDDAMAYWDIRPSRKFPTVEFRMADVMQSVDEVVVYAALVRALVETCLEGEDLPLRTELLRAASWRAALNGLSDSLLDPAEGRAYPAREMIDRFVAYLRPALEEAGDLDEVREGMDRLFHRGTGADRQRAAFAHRESVRDVLELAIVA